MPTDTVAIRAEIDTQTVRGLQLINGGTAAGLTAIVPTVLQHPSLRSLAAAMMVGIAFAAFGLVAAVVHNRLRRKCSLEYSRGDERAPPCRWKFFQRFASVPNEPCICTRSVMWMWASLIAFTIGAGSVVAGGWTVLAGETLGHAPWCIVYSYSSEPRCRFYSELHCYKSGLADAEESFCVPRPD